MSSTGVGRLLVPLAAILAVGVVVEALLFRMFSRTGIYLFDDGTDRWVYDAYQTSVWLGNAMFNFSALLVILLVALGAWRLWTGRDGPGRLLAGSAAALLVWNILLFFTSPGPVATVVYLIASISFVTLAVTSSWPRASTAVRVAIALLAASFVCVYYFGAVAPLRIEGLEFADQRVRVFQAGEILGGVAIVAAFLAWGRTRSLGSLVPAALVGVVLAGGLVAGSDRFPLISTWALGVTMSLPWFVYAATGALLSLTVLNLLRTGRPLLGLALVFLFLTHRMLPLTYFNLLILAGFLLIAVDTIEDWAVYRTEVIDGLPSRIRLMSTQNPIGR